MHPQAQISAEAVECAGLQGKFWQMHDQVFLNQQEWSGRGDALEVLLGYGAKLGLDEKAYQTCLSEHQTAHRISDEVDFAHSLGISGTPFFVFNSQGELYGLSGAVPYETFQQGIDRLLQQASP